MSTGFYELLQIPPDATPDSIRVAYQEQIAQVVRKARVVEARQQDLAAVEGRRQALAEAFAVLSDPARRRRYDRFRDLSRGTLPTDPETLWQDASSSMVDPAAAAALEVVRTLTDMKVGDPFNIKTAEDIRRNTENPDAKTAALAKARAKAEAEAKAEVNAKADAKAEARADARVEPKATPEAARVDARVDARPEPRVEARPEAKEPKAEPVVVRIDPNARLPEVRPRHDTLHAPLVEPRVEPIEVRGDGPRPSRASIPPRSTRPPPRGTLPPKSSIPPVMNEPRYDAEVMEIDDDDVMELPSNQRMPEPARSVGVPTARIDPGRLNPPRRPLQSVPPQPATPAEVEAVVGPVRVDTKGEPRKTKAAPPEVRAASAEDLARMVDQYGPTGTCLRAVREAKGHTLTELSNITRISHRFLDALERDAYTDLPAATFVRGYVKMVARTLNLFSNGPELDEFVEGYMARFHRNRG